MSSSRAGLRVLLVALNYHPEPTGSAPYVTRLAHHLAKSHKVTVMTGHPHYPSWHMRRAPSERRSNPRVIRYAHVVPRRPTTAARALYEISWLSSASRGLLPTDAYDLVVAVIPALSDGVLGLLAGRRYRCPVGVVFHDLYGPGASQSGITTGRAARVVGSIESAIARRASQLAVLTEDFRPYLEARGVSPSRILRLRNWGRLGQSGASVEETRARLRWSPTDFVCLHAGNMGQKQGLDNVVEAAALLRSSGVRLVLAGDGNDRENLSAQAEQRRLTNLAFLPVQAPGDYESMLAAADVLLLNQRAAVKEMSMPSKLTAYFWSGRPIVAAVDPNSAAAKEIARADAGRLVPGGDPSALAQAVLSLRSNPQERSRLGRNGRAYAETALGAENDLQDYDTFVARLIESPYRPWEARQSPSPSGGGQGGGS